MSIRAKQGVLTPSLTGKLSELTEQIDAALHQGIPPFVLSLALCVAAESLIELSFALHQEILKLPKLCWSR